MNQVTRTHNPFGESQSPTITTPTSSGALATTDAQRAVAEVQAALMIARANPRNPIRAMDNILNACTRVSLAESAIYTYGRGGSNVTGPSIRLAEALAQHWGNIQFGIREISQEHGSSTVQAYAWDVETNTRREMVFQVAHRRDTKSGGHNLTSSRDIYEHIANQGARRLRACILSVIPGDVVEAAVAQCDVTLRANADVSPEGVQRLVEAFASVGVTKEQIEKKIQRRIDSIQPAQIVNLRKIFVSLRDGMSTINEWFEVKEQAPEPAVTAIEHASKNDELKGTLKARKKKDEVLMETSTITDHQNEQITIDEDGVVHQSQAPIEDSIDEETPPF